MLYLGRNTLIVMAFNSVLIPFLNSFLTRAGVVYNSVVVGIRPVVIIVICYFISVLINRFLPCVIGRAKNKIGV